MNQTDLLDETCMTIEDAARELGCSRRLAEKIAIRHRILSGVITSPRYGAEILIFAPAIRAIVSGNYEIPEINPGVARSGKDRRK